MYDNSLGTLRTYMLIFKKNLLLRSQIYVGQLKWKVTEIESGLQIRP